jgi:hypothetical protein
MAVDRRKVVILNDDSASGPHLRIHFPKSENRIVQVHQQKPRKHQVCTEAVIDSSNSDWHRSRSYSSLVLPMAYVEPSLPNIGFAFIPSPSPSGVVRELAKLYNSNNRLLSKRCVPARSSTNQGSQLRDKLGHLFGAMF